MSPGRIVVLLLAILGLASMVVTNAQETEHWDITLGYTGQCHGRMEPCGCSKREIGGLRRRSGWAQWLHRHFQPVVLIDGGFAAPDPRPQNALKFAMYTQALAHMGYQVQFLGSDPWNARGLKATPVLLQLVRQGPGIRPYWRSRSDVLVIGADLERQSEQLPQVLAKQTARLTILIIQGSQHRLAEFLPKVQVVLLADAPHPLQQPRLQGKTLLLCAGDDGRYAGVLQLRLGKQGQIQAYRHQLYLLDESYAPAASIVQLYEDYKKKVRQARLLEQIARKVSPIGFVGTETCAECHSSVYQHWLKTGHAQAYATLAAKGQEQDPECVGCHVVGFGYEEGFTTPTETPEFQNVGCESCHGPGAVHMSNPSAAYGRTQGATTCLTCHTRERSPHFAFAEYYARIRH